MPSQPAKTEQTISEYFGKSPMLVISGTNDVGVSKLDFIVGLELEVESIEDFYLPTEKVNVTEDGSLRNCGREFITMPGTIDQAMERVALVHSGIKTVPDIPKFSERTSVHVHVNMLYLTPSEVQTLILLYAIFEPLAFAFVDKSRINNIHCVPLTYTHMANYYLRSLGESVEHWHKYTAFNIKPLCSYGTVEFRHLEGTDDLRRIRAWLNFIQYLYRNCLDRTPSTVLDLPKLLLMQTELLEIVRPFAQSPINYNVEDNLLDVKYAFLKG